MAWPSLGPECRRRDFRVAREITITIKQLGTVFTRSTRHTPSTHLTQHHMISQGYFFVVFCLSCSSKTRLGAEEERRKKTGPVRGVEDLNVVGAGRMRVTFGLVGTFPSVLCDRGDTRD